ncbi:MAG TPA: HEAT repeat domain-containing protein [Pirellulales bacterium]|nr:HEAT repeat domain-containing protein [Pirellulales bacterium]
MFDEESVANRWTVRLVRLSVAAVATIIVGWWAFQLLGSRGSGAKSLDQQVAVLRNHEEKAFARRVAAEALEQADVSIADDLTAELTGGDAVGRELAAVALGRLRTEPADAIDGLIAALDDPQQAVRRQAAIALGRIGARSEEASAALAESLEGSPEARDEIVRALRRLGVAGIRILPNFLAHVDAEVRRRVVIELGRAGDGDFLDELRRCLRDPDFRVRAEAQAALWRHSAIGLDDLIAALRDANPVVRSTACTLLGRLGGEAAPAIPELAKLLAAEDASAVNATQALGSIGKENAELISQLALLLEGEDERMAERAARLLSGFGRVSEDTRDRLLARVDDPRGHVAHDALHALHDMGLEGQLRPPQLIAALEEAGDGVPGEANGRPRKRPYQVVGLSYADEPDAAPSVP